MLIPKELLQDYFKEDNMYKLIDGKAIAAEIKSELKEQVTELNERGIEVCLAVIQVGDDKASSVYVNNKKNTCNQLGIQSRSFNLDENVSETELVALIQDLNKDKTVNGILVQLPLPKHINEDNVINAIHPQKDVDCFHPINVGELCLGTANYLPCTPAGIIELLERSKIEIEGKHCVVVGRSNIVGKPMSLLMLQKNATVTIAHSRTKQLCEITKEADILIVAIGKPKFLTKEYIKSGATVIDVGIHRDDSNKLCGDVDFEQVLDCVGAITPVPGGVGPMTIVMLMQNCIKAAIMSEEMGAICNEV